MAKRGGRKAHFNISKKRGPEGVSFQIPEGYDDGSGKFRHIKGGPNAGRVFWTSAHEASELAKRIQDKERVWTGLDR